jgi:hypothetical protein
MQNGDILGWRKNPWWPEQKTTERVLHADLAGKTLARPGIGFLLI